MTGPVSTIETQNVTGRYWLAEKFVIFFVRKILQIFPGNPDFKRNNSFRTAYHYGDSPIGGVGRVSIPHPTSELARTQSSDIVRSNNRLTKIWSVSNKGIRILGIRPERDRCYASHIT